MTETLKYLAASTKVALINESYSPHPGFRSINMNDKRIRQLLQELWEKGNKAGAADNFDPRPVTKQSLGNDLQMGEQGKAYKGAPDPCPASGNLASGIRIRIRMLNIPDQYEVFTLINI
uniref:Uncharacterized protein n=1 Tax=Romanomermis culicivorax TaxID=13658 RepID=A0A915JYA4_ROMCU